MSKNFDDIKKLFDNGLWTINKVRNAVEKGKITQEEYQIITGEVFA